jgi:hypothetical protein
MMNAHQSRSRLILAIRCCAFAIALCLAVAPIGMTCCSGMPCSASHDNGNSDLPCHGSRESHAHHTSSAAAEFSACHAGELALEALRMEHDFRKVPLIEGHASSVNDVSSPYASVLEVSSPFALQTCAISPHLDRQTLPLQLRI